MAGLADAVRVNTQAGTVNANAPGAGTDGQVSNFVTAQSFATFGVAAPVMKLLWELIRAIAGGWADDYAVPVVLCMVYALWQILVSLTGPKPVRGFAPVSTAVFIGVVNGGILAAAVVGLTETTNTNEPS
jgi:hypothetical protein